MLHIGCHLSCAKGYLSMGEQALALGADTFQFFTRNPRGGSVKPFDRQDADALNDFEKPRSARNAVRFERRRNGKTYSFLGAVLVGDDKICL